MLVGPQVCLLVGLSVLHSRKHPCVVDFDLKARSQLLSWICSVDLGWTLGWAVVCPEKAATQTIDQKIPSKLNTQVTLVWREPNSHFFLQIFADLRMSKELQHIGGADFHRKPLIFTEGRRKPQRFAEIHISRLVCPVNSSLEGGGNLAFPQRSLSLS